MVPFSLFDYIWQSLRNLKLTEILLSGIIPPSFSVRKYITSKKVAHRLLSIISYNIAPSKITTLSLLFLSL